VETQKKGTACRAPTNRRYRSSLLSVNLVRDYKVFRETGVWRGFFLLYLANAGEARATFELRAQVRQLLGRSAGEDFHAAVVQITHIATQMQFCGGMLCKVAKSHTLDGAGDEVPFGLLRLAHGK